MSQPTSEMNETGFNWKSFIKALLVLTIIIYSITFVVVGVIWDPNGVNLFQRPLLAGAKIVLIGLVMSLPLGLKSLISIGHPVAAAISLGFLGCAIVAWMGRSTTVGRRVLYVLFAMISCVGTIRFCFMA